MTESVERNYICPCRRAAVRTLAALLAVLTSACGEEPVEQAPVARPVKMLQLGEAGAGETREYPGTISATQHVEMAFEVPGKIIEFPVSESQRVSEGTLLARLDPRDFEAERESARALLKSTEAEYERMKILYEKGVNSKRDLEVAQRNYEVSLANVKTADKAVEDATLRAPFPGIVAKKLVDDFSNVQAKQPVLVLQDDSTLEIVVNLPERDLAGARPGTSIEDATARVRPRVSVTSLPDRVFPARIKEYSTTADPVTRTFEATVAFDKPRDVVIRPGMTAKLIISVPTGDGASQGHMIPASATLADESGAAFVWEVDPSSMRVSRLPVELGELSGTQVQVRGGLEAGDLIVVSGVHHLREGMEVRRFTE